MAWSTRERSWRVLKPLSRGMRRECTPAEASLWQRLRHDRLGVRFRRQFVIGQFIADFYCPQRRLVIEVDGGVHADRLDIDRERDRVLQSLGLRVLRFHNDEILQDVETVVARILSALSL
jgi:very-short-patch-repair endonuclease